METAKNFSLGESLSFGWDVFKKNIGLLIGSTALYMLIVFVATWLDANTYGLASLVTSTIVSMGWISIQLKLIDGQPAKLSDLVTTYRPFLNYALAAIIFGVLVAAGFLALIIPGMYLLLVLLFWHYLIIDKNMGPIEALKASSHITKGVRWQLLGFILISAVLNMAGALVIGIGVLVTAPVTALAMAHVYRKLLSQTPEVAKRAP